MRSAEKLVNDAANSAWRWACGQASELNPAGTQRKTGGAVHKRKMKNVETIESRERAGRGRKNPRVVGA